MEICITLILLSSVVMTITADLNVRLVNGGGHCAGRVEVLHDGQWGTVCDNNWDMTDAAVVCRELSCGVPLGIVNFGSGSGQIWMDDVHCNGSESSLKNCTSNGWGVHNCYHSLDIGIICSNVNVRLVKGASSCSGRVEVLHDGQWGTVCDDGWDVTDAGVVCRELDCGDAVQVLHMSHFGSGSGQIWMDVSCNGSESTLKNCRSRGWGVHDRNLNTNAGVICSNLSVRLVNGDNRCAGRVEVLQGGQWITMCGSVWDLTDAAVVCRELGCGKPLGIAHFGPASGPIWTEQMHCNGSESTLKNCRSGGSNVQYCGHHHDAGVICSILNVRLVNGDSRCSGRVEVLRDGQWGTVCGDGWDLTDASVVCSEMGCGDAIQVLNGAHFGGGSGKIWMNDVDCSGSESTLKNCTSSVSDCDHDKDVGVICSNVNVRLVNGSSACSGRVEILHGRQWGTVCDFSWDLIDAAVVCRELDCGEPVQALHDAYFGQGSGPIWLDYVRCKGSESSLKNCVANQWGVHYCSHIRDAGVMCSDGLNYGWSRLVAGSHLCSGRVEMYYGGRWGTVCDAAFDDQDAEVVCRELNCGVPVQLLGADAFGEGEGNVWTKDIPCRGNESHINLCTQFFKSSSKNNCSHENDVGLICSGYTDLRLVNGSDICSGRVERQYLTEWGTVCDGCMNMRAASVVCRQLNCGIAVSVLGVDWFGEGSGEIWADVFDCQGNETQLSQCSISSWSRAEYSHKQDVGVICSNSSLSLHDGGVRLSGERECEGELEVYIDQVWRRVLLDSWSVTQSSVVCRQLGCGSVLNFSGSSSSSAEHGHECVMGFKCSGTEHHLRNCSSSTQTLNCSSTQHLSITCLGESSIRLVGSGGDCAGRLEVFHKGSWGTVCDDSWDIKDAHVVCRQLQCGVALSDVPAWFGPGSGPIWLDDVNCEGNETSLWNCSSRVWGDHDCKHKEDVGVVCSEFKEIRLSEGCEGNMEVFYNGSWSNVCYNQMDRDTASLICQELNCGRSASEPSSSKNGLKTHNWQDKFKCRSHDSTLWQCPSSLWAQNDCGPSGIVKITCSELETHQSPRSRLTCSTSPSPHQRQCSSHVPLRLGGGEGLCSGRLEVYHNSEWGSVCDDLWDIRDAQVVCRQLGCGAALSADGNEAFGAGEDVVWLNRVECRGTEIHLWDCPHVLKNHTDCSHKEHVELICADLSAFTTPATTATTTTTSLPLMSESLFISPEVVIVLGVLLLLLLVPLLILIQHNRVMRRALSKRRHWTQTEAVYEEIDHRHTNKHFTQRERHSGYEDVNEPFTEEDICVYDNDVFTGSTIKAKQVKKVSLGYYNDVNTDEPTADIETGDMPENYDDVIIIRHNIDGVNDGVQEEYDDVRHISADKSGMEEDCETGVQEEYDDVKNVRFVKVRP
ncbi:Antigen WC1.1 [Triplophysa tibetana]|uniref:Antigen WC1.1 n=1 Tax=Triplophysa tibetana TaxID=1572043 RepID=A0A5A9PEP7_9TELE|nr:Antigen WC1.1 [Triplophysa tibetana]